MASNGCLVIAGVFVAAVDYSCLGNLRRGGSAWILGYGEQERDVPRRNCADNEQSDGSDGSESKDCVRRPGGSKPRSSQIQATSAVG